MSETTAAPLQHRCELTNDPWDGWCEFSCSCGVAFTVWVFCGALKGHKFGGRDPRRCPDAIPAIVRRAGLERWVITTHVELAEAAGEFREKPNAGLTCEAGGGRVSRPPQSAPANATSCSHKGHDDGSDRLCSADAIETGAKNAIRSRGRDGYVEGLRDLSPPASATDTESSPGARETDPSAGLACDPSPGADESDAPVLLANQVDTDEIAWRVRVAPKDLERLEATKKKVQEQDADGPDQVFELGGERWILLPKGGRRHQYVLENERAMLAVAKRQTETVPALRFKLRSATGWSLGFEGARDWVQRVALAIHTEPERGELSEDEEEEPPRPLTSRVDLAADFLGMPLEGSRLEDFVVRPRRRGRYFKLEKDDLDCAEFWSGLKHTGDSFGKGDLSARVYNKTREIKDQSPDKVWLYAFWKRCGACGCRENEHERTLGKNGDTDGAGRCAREGCDCASFVIDETGFMDARPCGACAETGAQERAIRCQDCRGRGRRFKAPCGGCEGSGRTTKPRKCKVCKGKKTTCDQVWRVEIQLRRAALVELVKGVERTCPTCAGLGERTFKRDCRRCKGEGRWSCLVCEGTGRRKRGPCKRCEGTGAVTCRRCQGAGHFAKNKKCKRCQERGSRTEKPMALELANPLEVPGLVVATDRRGARNVGEELAIDVDTTEGLRSALKAIWRYCVGGGRGVRPWLSWRRPTENEQRTRWPLRDEWRAVQAVGWETDTKDELVRLKRVRSSFKRTVPQVAGHLSTAIAHAIELEVNAADLYDRACGLMWREVETYNEQREQRKREDFAATVARKRTTVALWGLLGETRRRNALQAEGIPVPVEVQDAQVA